MTPSNISKTLAYNRGDRARRRLAAATVGDCLRPVPGRVIRGPTATKAGARRTAASASDAPPRRRSDRRRGRGSRPRPRGRTTAGPRRPPRPSGPRTRSRGRTRSPRPGQRAQLEPSFGNDTDAATRGDGDRAGLVAGADEFLHGGSSEKRAVRGTGPYRRRISPPGFITPIRQTGAKKNRQGRRLADPRQL